MKLIVKEIPTILGINSRDKKEDTNSWDIIMIIVRNTDQINIWTTLIATGSVIFVFLAINRYPRVPWHLMLMIVATIVGLTVNGNNNIFKFSTFGGELSKGANFQIFLREVLNNHYYNKGFLTFKQPIALDFFLNSAFLAIMTLMEATATIRLTSFAYKCRYLVAPEFVGIGVGNILAGLIGLLPMGYSVTRNVVAIGCRARTSVFTLFSLLLLIFFTLVFLEAFTSMPVVFKSMITITIGMRLVDVRLLVSYVRSQYVYGGLMVIFILISMMVEVAFCIFLFYGLYFFIYLQQSGTYCYTLGSVDELKTQIEIFNVGKVLDKFTKETLEEYLITGEEKIPDSIMRHLDHYMLIYQFRGLFGFLHCTEHISNMKLARKTIIVLDFRYVHLYDLELITEYYKILSRIAKDVRLSLFVTGLPKAQVDNNKVLEESWVVTLKGLFRIIYIN